MDRDKRHFLLRRLHSLSGLVPVGAFLLEHFYTNATVKRGLAGYDEGVADLWAMFRSPTYLMLFEWAFIFLPLLFHGGYGLYIWWTGQSNVTRFGTFRNWMYSLQRWTGAFLVVFLGYHLYHTWALVNFTWGHSLTGVSPYSGQVVGLGQYMAEYFASSGLIVAFYVAGIFAATLHLANGVWNMAVVWGLTISRRSQGVFGVVCMALFAILFLWGMDALVTFKQLSVATATLQ